MNCNLIHTVGPAVPVQQGDNGVGAAALRIFVDHRAAQDPGAADFMSQQAESVAAPAAQVGDQEGEDDHLWTDLFYSDVAHEIKKYLQIVKNIYVMS